MELYQKINKMDISTLTVKQIRDKGLHFGRLFAVFNDICHGGPNIRGGKKTAWKAFEETAYSRGYPSTLEMAAEILILSIQDMNYSNLAIYISYLYFMDSETHGKVRTIVNRLLREESNRRRNPNKNLLYWGKILKTGVTSQSALEKVFDNWKAI